ncbi:MAG: B12-binding domain-containing radical SAM protein [Chloroflexi bacterium]|nr:B12-binding domain-containing radical SAM protein [Chloroflexota bacterium]
MKPKVVLFHPMTLHEKNYRYYYVPYSILSIASMVDREKYEVIVIDNNVNRRDDYFEYLQGISDGLLCVGVSAMMGHQTRDGLAFSRAVRQATHRVPIIWGGPLPTILPQETLENDLIDIIIQGQGEVTFSVLVDALANGQSLDSVEGISYKLDNQIFHTPSRKFADINNFPPYKSVYDFINVENYVRFDEHINSRTTNYHSSQGCPFNCGFCCETTLWNHKWSAFSASRTLDDIEFLTSHFKINGIKFYDSEFFIDQKRVIEFAKGVIDRGLEIRWAASVHPKNLNRMSDDQVDLLQRSGVSRLLLGAESGIQDELELVGKGTNREMIVRLAKLCSRYDIVACFTFVTGYPTSPLTHIDTTLEFAKELRKIDKRHECKVHFYAPYPGTPLYSYALQNGFAPPRTIEEWSWYDYYDIVTPWVDKDYEKKVRDFNEEAYPYLHPLAGFAQDGTA